MDNHLITLGIAVLLLAVGLSGCQEESEENKFIGIWKLIENYLGPEDTTDTTMEIYSNGSVKIVSVHYNNFPDETDTYTSIYGIRGM